MEITTVLETVLETARETVKMTAIIAGRTRVLVLVILIRVVTFDNNSDCINGESGNTGPGSS